MRADYSAWISEHVSKTYGTCAEVTLAMQQAFPELKRVRGHYYCAIWGQRAHWWLVAPDGSIVDPTKDQFPTKGTGFYEPWTEGAKEPTGICMNCGEYCYDGDPWCSESCGRYVCRDLGIPFEQGATR